MRLHASGKAVTAARTTTTINTTIVSKQKLKIHELKARGGAENLQHQAVANTSARTLALRQGDAAAPKETASALQLNFK